MVNILVPTDFSELSRVALDYAIEVANKLNANITLNHVVTVVQPTRATMRLRLEALEVEMMKIAKEDMESLIDEVSKNNTTGHPIKYNIAKGSSFNSTVKSEAKRLKSGLIIMGSHGASGIKKVWGSNTASLIEISHIPVLVIPELAKFNGFGSILYATDLKHLDGELAALVPYTKIFGSTLEVFHVAGKENNIKEAEEKIKAALTKDEYTGFTQKVVVAKEIDKAIEDEVKKSGSDLMAIFTHHHSLYERLFENRVTRQLAYWNKLPMLAFKQNN